MRILRNFFLILFLFIPTLSQASRTDSLPQKIQSIVNQDRIKYDLPSLSVSIKLPNNKHILNFVSGYKSLKQKNLITPNTLFQIGSLTKTFTAVLILNLMEQDKLKLSNTLGMYLPNYPRWKNITIKQLLTHTSGVYKYIDTPDFWVKLKKHPNTQFSLNQLANLAYYYPDYFKPGQGYNYTDTDYVLLGLIVEKITDNNLSDLYNKFILKNLSHSYYLPHDYSKNILNQIARGYDFEGTFGDGVDVTKVNTSFAASAGAMVSTPNNIVRFINLIFTHKIITKKSLDTMQQGIPFPKSKNNKNPWQSITQDLGMGLVHINNYGNTWMHAGGMPGYQSMYSYNPKKKIILALAYNKQPKKNFVFLYIAMDIYRVLDNA